ncbi:caspase family protein [Actinocrispum wychmicini]|uniref:Caspase domain-containing protein n=1 Tax=Actinocrispum wychmicini TaxID=1213861 RepID=A0A4R2JN91_9PSEU|nr:caspase family protein [Actinocrispum wychmicini]TCO55645.1 caspase domain-containing protein [Actinocrispum wychmicini]
MSTIDFTRSRAILVGTGHYTHGLPGMPAALNSLAAMRALLTGPHCGWPKSRIAVFPDKTTGARLDQRIAALIHDTTDVLLFYYVGHGQLLDGEHLGMALVDTHSAPTMRYATSLRLNDLREELTRRCSARVKVVILDCCFSGLATRNTQGIGLADQVRLVTKVEGAYTLTASRASQKAIYEDGPAGLTYFTKIFTDVVHDGIPGTGAQLTLKNIHQEVATRLLHLNLPDGHLRPEPSTLVMDTAEQLAFARNVAHSAGTPGNPPQAGTVASSPSTGDTELLTADIGVRDPVARGGDHRALTAPPVTAPMQAEVAKTPAGDAAWMHAGFWKAVAPSLVLGALMTTSLFISGVVDDKATLVTIGYPSPAGSDGIFRSPYPLHMSTLQFLTADSSFPSLLAGLGLVAALLLLARLPYGLAPAWRLVGYVGNLAAAITAVCYFVLAHQANDPTRPGHRFEEPRPQSGMWLLISAAILLLAFYTWQEIKTRGRIAPAR